MAQYHDFPVQMWEVLPQFPHESQLIFVYLWTNPRCRPSGLFKISLQTIENDLRLVGRLTGPLGGGPRGGLLGPLRGPLLEYDFDTQEVWLKYKLKHIRKLFDNIPMQKSIQTDIKLLESDFLKGLFLGVYEKIIGGPRGPLSHSQSHSHGQSQEKREEREKREKQLFETPDRNHQNFKPSEPEDTDYTPEIRNLVQDTIAKLKRKAGIVWENGQKVDEIENTA